MAGVGSGRPSVDPSGRPTRIAEYGAGGSLQQILDNEPDPADSAEPDVAPNPWYRNPVLLALWTVALALLLTLIVYGLVELSRGGDGGGPATTTSSPTKTRSSTTSSSTTSSTTRTTVPAPSSEAPPPPPETPEQTPDEAPPPANSPAPADPPRHHHHLHLPHLPHGFF